MSDPDALLDTSEPCRRAARRIELMAFERITVEPGKMGGVACIRGLRIPVATVADGMTATEITRELPSLDIEDVAEALRFAADALLERELPLLRPA